MRKLRIVSDSSFDILELENVDFAYAPMKIITAEREFVDDKNLDVDEMANFFNLYKGRSQTSCPNVTDWIDAFGDADDIICVTITSALSGSYNSECLAKQIYEEEYEGRRVFVLDTLSAGPEITLVIKKLEEYVKQGMEYETICERIKAYLKQTGLVFVLKSLHNFAANGRVSPLVAKVAGFAGICIAGKASDEGTLEPSHKCRGENKSLDAILSDIEKYGLRNGKVSIGHCQNEKAAERLQAMIKEKFDKVQIEIHKLRGLCSFYAEKGGLLVGFEKY
ncbi:MAG: DegV family protein [Clostridia bacterium]|nr:DegV family protein [Clostridia bacterium]